MAAPPPSRGQPHSVPRAFAAARHCLPSTNSHPGRLDSTRHAIRHDSLVTKPSRPAPYCKRPSPNPTGPSHRGVTFPPEQLGTVIQDAGRSRRRSHTPLPGHDPPSGEPAFPLSKTRGRHGCGKSSPLFSGQPTSPLPLPGY